MVRQPETPAAPLGTVLIGANQRPGYRYREFDEIYISQAQDCLTLIIVDFSQDCWTHIRRDSGASTQHSTEKDRSRKGSYVGGTPPSVVRHYSPDSESSNSQTDYSPTCNSRYLNALHFQSPEKSLSIACF